MALAKLKAPAWEEWMESPQRSSSALTPSGAPAADGVNDDLLKGFDDILAEVADRDREEVQHEDEVHREVVAYLDAFHEVCRTQARPAMEIVLQRLTTGGGGGDIEEHPGGEPRYQHPSLVLWMSLEGPITGEPRPDRDPYLQLEANVPGRNIQVWEGDMWRGAGGKRSGPVGTWELSDVTREGVVGELLAIARRAATPQDR